MATDQPIQPLLEGYRQVGNRWEVVVNHTISGVTPEQIDWWWDHIDSTERYQLWHPTDHVSFLWLIPPTNGHVGAVQRVVEFLNGEPDTPATFDIRWEDAAQAAAEYSHILLATAKGRNDLAGLEVQLMHEYQAAEIGTHMRSHFRLPSFAPEAIVKALYEHNKQEMQYFSAFLPTLYETWRAASLSGD